jgi:uncharacterized protein YycO
VRASKGILVALASAGLLAGCATSVVVTPPATDLKSAREAQILADIRRFGRNGDWLVIRGYHDTDHFVAAVTNTPWSHAAVLDLDRDEVVEADAKGVHRSSLAVFLQKTHRLLIVRPDWSTEKTSLEALASARSHIGKGYDFLGLVGVNNAERFYCSELAVAVYRPYMPAGQRIPRPVAPSQLHYWGRILYDSGAP